MNGEGTVSLSSFALWAATAFSAALMVNGMNECGWMRLISIDGCVERMARQLRKCNGRLSGVGQLKADVVHFTR
jgi:hypothetical protein